MNFDDYQDATERTAIYPDEIPEWLDPELVYLALGISGEAGEVAEKVKKAIREDDEVYMVEAIDECGDLLWYLARFLDEQNQPMSEVAAQNMDKLLDRQARDQLTGQGDDR
jgi:NTP pyrophosphatase (non-canonical NTP hydrolase)